MFILVCLISCFFAVSCYDDEIEGLRKKIEALEGTQIASLQEQVTAIKNTLPELEKTDKELNTYIKSLQSTESNLEKSINETNDKIEEVKSALKDEISTEKATIMAQLTELKSDLEAELAKINSTIVALQKKDAELDKKIADLKAYVDTELAKNKDWVNATFATLEQYSSLATEIATIKSSITALNNSIEFLEKRMAETVTTEIAKALEPIKDELVANVISDIADSYLSAIANAKDEISTAYTAAIAAAVSTLETSMKSWVCDQLKGYCTIAEVEGKLATLKSSVAENDKAIQTEIEEIGKKLSKTEKEITEAYSKAIEDAIIKYEGVINGKIATAISEANVKIENEIKAINEKIAAIESRLDRIEGDIATIGEQIAGINATIKTLEETEAELEEYIKSLQSTAAGLLDAINETNSKIDEIENALEGGGAQAKEELMAQLNAMRSEMGAELEQINATIAALQAKDAELDEKIVALKAYVDTELAKNTNWANATFATLEQYSVLASEVAAIKAQIVAVNTSIAELENRLSEKWENDLANATATLDATIQNKVAEITTAYSSAISDAKDEITTAYTVAIAESISSLEASMISWVSNKLKGYYTIAEVEGKLTALMSIVSDNDNTVKGEIEELRKSIANIKKEIANDYIDAIEKAITENNGTIDGKIAQAIAQVNSRIEDEIAEINTKIEAIESRLDKIENDIAELMRRIQSVSYIPQFSDGKVTLGYNNEISRARLDFEISPKDAVIQLAEVWKTALSVKSVHTITRAVEFISMPIVSFSADENTGVISMYVSGENLLPRCLESNITPSVAIEISDGNNSITSDYIPMIVEEVTKEIWYTSTNNNSITPYNASAFDANIVLSTYELGMGVIRFDSPITKIGNQAFYDKNELSEITLPSSVTSIGEKAFYNCDNLTKVNMGNNIQEISNQAFANNKRLRNITIPNSVTSISSVAFAGSGIESFTSKYASTDNRCLIIDGTLTHFANYGITEYTIPGGIQKIGDYAFSNCENLVTLNLMSSVKEIGNYAFLECNKLTDFIIPESVTTIGDYAFYGCDGLKEITIPRNTTSLGEKTFNECSSLEIIDCKPLTPPDGSKMFANNAENLIIYVSIGALSKYRNSENWMEYNEYIEAIIEPNYKITYTTTDNKAITPKVEAFGLNIAYNQCDNGVGLIVFDGDITTIGDEAFKDCTTLKTISYPESVTAIGAYAFKGCTNLIEFIVSENITFIGQYALSGCPKLENVTLNSNTLGSHTFANSKITILYVNCNLTDSYDGLQLNGATYDNIIFGENVTTIGSSSFSNNCTISNITIGKNVKNIGDYAFSNTTIEKITIPDNVTQTGTHIFAGCKNLNEVIIGSGLTIINDNMFYNCTNLKSIIIPSNVTQIKYRAFQNCSSLSTIYCMAANPPSLEYSNYNSVFDGGPQNRIIYVPAASKSVYSSDTQWNKTLIMGYDYNTGTVAPPENNEIWYTTTDGQALSLYSEYFDQNIISNKYTNGLGVITFSGDIKELKPYAFHKSTLKTIYLPKSLTTIPCFNYDGVNGSTQTAFFSQSLEEVYIAGSPNLSGNPFYGCDNIKKFNGPLATADGRALIKGKTLYSFAGASTKEFTIPSTITTIGNAAFSGCTNIERIVIPASVTTMQYDAFYNCYNVTVDMSSVANWCNITFANMYANPIYTGGEKIYVNGVEVSTLTIPASVTAIKKWAFAGANVKSIVVGDYVTTIEEGGFDWNQAETVTIGKKVTSIGANAFRDTDSYRMTELYIKATTPPSINSDPFSGYTNNIYVPTNSVNTYKSNTYWKSYYSNKIVGYNF